MTQPGGAPEGYTPRKYESEVYAEVTAANAKKDVWLDPDWHDAAMVAGQYSTKSAQVFERKLAAAGGGYRPGLDSSDVDYRAMPHERLQAMVHDGASAEEVDEQGQVVNDLGNVFKELTGTIQQAVSKEQAGWQGHGAEAAFAGLGGLSKWLDSSGDAAFLTANRYSQTSAAIANAQHAMPEPAGQPVLQSMAQARQQLSSGDFLAAMQTYQNAQTQANAAFQVQQQAAAVLTARDQTFYGTSSTQPIYAPPPPPVAPAPAAAASWPGGSVTGSNAVIPQTGHTTAASAFTPPAPAGTSGSSPVPTAGNPISGGSLTGANPVSGTPVSDPPGGWSRPPGSTLNPGLDAGLVPTVGGTGGGGDTERGGSGRSGSAAGRAAGRVPAGGTTEEPGAGKKTGTAEPGAKAAAEAARSGAAGKTGKAGTSGMPGAAGGKKGEEDKEHKRPAYIVNDDPNETYGLTIETDENGNKIAPPVIG